jgi:hypothetical protein
VGRAQRPGPRLVSVDERDNDPKVLLSYVAEALDRVQPVGERVFEALASPVSSVPGSVVPRLGSAFWSMNMPLVLVLDDVHLLHKTESRDALSVLADHVPGGSRLVLAGRNEPPLRTARLRAEGRISEIGPDDLSLTREEATSLLRAAGVRLCEDDLTTLHQRTEGWPAGLYLAALYLREGGSLGTAAVSFGGDDRLVSEYMEAEFLARVSQRHRVFLTRTAVLERMSGPLCEAVLELPGSAATLAELSQSNLLLVPLDRRRMWYRYHHLFRDMLLAELERLEPGDIDLPEAGRLVSPPGGHPGPGSGPSRGVTAAPSAVDLIEADRLHGQVLEPVQQAVELRRIAYRGYHAGIAVAGFNHQVAENGGEQVAAFTAENDPVAARRIVWHPHDRASSGIRGRNSLSRLACAPTSVHLLVNLPCQGVI